MINVNLFIPMLESTHVISLLQWFTILYDSVMMTINFFIIWKVVRSEFVNRRALLFFTSIILYMAAESFAIGYIVFYHGTPFVEVPSLVLASLPLLASVFVKQETVRLNASVVYSFLFSSSIVVDEVGMGYLFAGAFGINAGNWLANSVSNIAFGVMMLADAVFFLLASRKRDRAEWAGFTFAASMAFLPNVVFAYGKALELAFSLVASVLMIVNIVLLYLLQLGGFTLRKQLFAVSLALFNFVMMLGLSHYAISSNLLGISVATLVSMFWYLFLEVWNPGEIRIAVRPSLTFAFLVFINLAELAMGFGESVLGFTYSFSIFHPAGAVSSMGGHMGSISETTQASTSMGIHSSMQGMSMTMPMRVSAWSSWDPLWWLFPVNPYAMTLMMLNTQGSILEKLFWAPYMLVMMTTMMPFYVIMMGSEMAFLVWERYRKVKNPSVKRWALVIIASLPIFVVLVPYYTPYYVFGMSGMIIPVQVVPYVISLVAVVAAVVLFGRRAYCNAVCMAAHMWTNVWYDQFKPKKHWKGWDYLRWVFLVPAVLVLILFPLWSLGILPAPPKPSFTSGSPANFYLDFYGMFVLNYVWWFFYFLTPVFGTYSCARQGWCGFGTLMGLGNKLFFKVKAKDVKVCQDCKSVSCEGVCPVKIDIRSDVLKKGYVNRISCVGCGDCVEACEYNNLEIRSLVNV